MSSPRLPPNELLSTKLRADARTLRANMVWTGCGYAVYLVSQLGVLVALAHLTTPEDVGRFGFGLAVTTPVMMFSNLGLRIGRATDVHEQFAFEDYFGLRSVTSAIAFLLMVVVGYVVSSDSASFWVIVTVAAMKAAEAFSDLFYGVFQRYERMHMVARSLALRGPATLLLFTALLWLTRCPALALTAQFMVWSIVAIFHDRPAAASLSGVAGVPRFDLGAMQALAVLSLPLGVGGLLNALSDNTPRYVVKAVLGLKALGYFTAIAYALQAGIFFANALGHAVSGRLAKLQSQEDMRTYRKLLIRIAAAVAGLSGLGGLVVAIFGENILVVIFGQEYAAFKSLFVVIMLALAARSTASILQFGLLARRRFKAFGILNAALLPLIIVLSLIGVTQFGLLGVAGAIFLTALVRAFIVCCNIFSKKKNP